MKQLICLLVLLAVAAPSSSGAAPPNESAAFFISGEHYPLRYNGVGTIFGAAHPCTTAWVQVGWSDCAGDAANRNVGRFNPQLFTVGLKLACYGSGDSARVSKGRFESAYDTTAAPFWSGDSSNIFIQSGSFSHPDYGVWRFETLANTARRWLYPARLLVGGYVRLILESGIADSCSVEWTLIGEH